MSSRILRPPAAGASHPGGESRPWLP